MFFMNKDYDDHEREVDHMQIYTIDLNLDEESYNHDLVVEILDNFLILMQTQLPTSADQPRAW